MMGVDISGLELSGSATKTNDITNFVVITDIDITKNETLFLIISSEILTS
jgi:hypothetical protein